MYGRPLISYLLMGKTDRARMLYRPKTFYEEQRVALRLGVSAEAIDSQRKTVTLHDGETVPYDQLLVATGSRPFVPPIAGLDTVEQWGTFTTLEDAEKLQRRIDARSRVLIVGAGLIGLKCAEGIHAVWHRWILWTRRRRSCPARWTRQGRSACKGTLSGAESISTCKTPFSRLRPTRRP